MEAAAAGAVRALWNLSFNKQNLAAMKGLGYSVSESLTCEWVLGVVTSVERARVTSSRRASSAAGLHPPQDGPSVSSAAREEFQITSALSIACCEKFVLRRGAKYSRFL